MPNQRQSWWFDALSVVQRGTRGDLLASFVWFSEGKSSFFFIICFSSCLFVPLLDLIRVGKRSLVLIYHPIKLFLSLLFQVQEWSVGGYRIFGKQGF